MKNFRSARFIVFRLFKAQKIGSQILVLSWTAFFSGTGMLNKHQCNYYPRKINTMAAP
jgi:hypothetical protein